MDDITDHPATATPARREHCPRCGEADAAQILLTSMTRYFKCLHCTNRWNVAIAAVDEQADFTGRMKAV
jgi:DNA-directed RNA polymerase subunit M/transcription elongation factor TFIIS